MNGDSQSQQRDSAEEGDRDADEEYDDFDPYADVNEVGSASKGNDIKSLNLPFRPSAFTFESAYAVGPEIQDVDIAKESSPTPVAGPDRSFLFGSDKTGSLLDSLLGPSPAKKAPSAPATPAPAPAAPATPPPPVPSQPAPEPEPEPQAESEPVVATATEEPTETSDV
jgi:hypothetical protein